MIVSDSAHTRTTTVAYSRSIQQYIVFMTARCTAVLLLAKSWYGRYVDAGYDKALRATVILQCTQHKGIPSARAKRWQKCPGFYFSTRYVVSN